eukprot:588644-Alexandrium_andersonii.AAC.1
MEPGRGWTPRSATARRRALRAAALRRLQAGASFAMPPSEELAAAVASHHAALWRLAARAIDAYGAPTPVLERPPAGVCRVDRPAAGGGGEGWRSCSPRDAS